MKIHETAIIDSKAEIGSGTSIGPYARVEGDVVIGKDCEIMQGVQILAGARIGDRCCFHQGAVISSLPQDKKFSGGRSFLEIGDESVIREYSTISRSTQLDGSTVIGNNAYIMTGVHIGHDCKIGDGVTMANLVTLAGHVTVERLATIGGMTAVHQFVRVGELAMVGGDSGLMMDAPPYMITFGYAPARVYGINSIGLKRNDIDENTRMFLKRAFKLLFRSNHNISQAIGIIRKEMPQNDTIKHLVEFFRNTKRGISVSANSMKVSGYHAHNGHSESNFDFLMEIVKDEKVAREIMSFIEAKTGDADRYAN